MGDKFIGTLTWTSDNSDSKLLNAEFEDSNVEMLRYIPQSYLEKVCNDADIIKADLFERELEDVIYSHISQEDRLGKNSLQDLANFKTEQVNKRLVKLREALEEILKKIIKFEKILTNEYKEKNYK